MSHNFGSTTTGDEVVTAFPDSVKNRIFVLTGPSPGGLGAATLLALAKAGPRALVLAGRTPAAFAPVAEQIAAIDANIRVVSVALDLASLASVRAAAAAIIANEDIPHIDVLINNGGLMACPLSRTADGLEMQFGTNHIGHFLFTALIMPKLRKASEPRVVNLSSSGHRIGTIEGFEDYNWETTKYNGFIAYGQSKLANIFFTNELARRFGPQGLKAYSLHPGSVNTDLHRHLTEERQAERLSLLPIFQADPDVENTRRKGLEDGCSTTLVAALTPAEHVPNGAYFADCQLGKPKATTKDVQAAQRVWELSERLVGCKFE
ncbi:NAD(P)-binding protein [Exidia glandulosa HHB12029]|uniref:NAD(P)-binding protein n=1 Tax=Exidia glandulosa HHB12029 TaxID=1314781 RepID=A0A165PRW1_EXIGL|nr:NAD(P)-binding protein [Exidia glandulosa HHB12029]